MPVDFDATSNSTNSTSTGRDGRYPNGASNPAAGGAALVVTAAAAAQAPPAGPSVAEQAALLLATSGAAERLYRHEIGTNQALIEATASIAFPSPELRAAIQAQFAEPVPQKFTHICYPPPRQRDLYEEEHFALFWSEVTGVPHITLTSITHEGQTETSTFSCRDGRTLKSWPGGGQSSVEIFRNVYFHPNETPPGCNRKPSRAQMVAALCRHVDIEPVIGLPQIEERRRLLALAEALAANPATRPTVIIDSGNGIQILWATQREVLTPDAIARVEVENRAIAAVLGADAAFNVDRLLRLPGTLNLPTLHKQQLGRRVSTARRLFLSPSFYTAAEAASLFQALTAAVARSGLVHPRPPKWGADRPPGGQPSAPLPPQLAALVAAADNVGRGWLGITIAEKTALYPALRKRWAGDWSGLLDQTRSGRAMCLGSELRGAGLDFVTFVAALTAHPDTRDWAREKRTLDGGRELWRTWSRARTARVDEEAPPDHEPAQGHDRRQLNQLNSDSKPEPDSDPGPQSTGEGSHARERHQRRDAPGAPLELKLPRFRGVFPSLGDYGSVACISIIVS